MEAGKYVAIVDGKLEIHRIDPRDSGAERLH